MHCWVEHTAELGLEIVADTREGVFAEGFTAMRHLLGEGANAGGEAVELEVELESADGATLLADWLAELAFLAETDGLVPERVESLEVGERSLRARVHARRSNPDHLVKAVTYHGLVLEPGWRASVVLDV